MFKEKIVRAASKAVLKTKAKSPELLIGAGIVSLIGAGVLASKATVEVMQEDGPIHTHLKTREKIELVRKDAVDPEVTTLKEEDYDEESYKKDILTANVQTAIKVFTPYIPALTLAATGVFCILSGHNILKKRNVAVMAAYKALEVGFKDYRGRVVEEFGEEVDYKLKNGISNVKNKYEKVGENELEGNTIDVVDAGEIRPSIYSKFFDQSCPDWTKDAEHNLFFLSCQEKRANQKLHACGHLFLNEVYDMLGMNRTSEGAVTGWIDGEGDSYVDFGIYRSWDDASRRFVNGDESVVLLDFNVDGLMYDKI